MNYELSSVYLDNHTTYKSNAKPTVEEALCNSKPLSEFERALGELGVGVIHANSPQAKGSPESSSEERLFGTFQDRLIKEMRLKDINTVEDANRFLQYYLPISAISYELSANFYRILCIKAKRVLRNDFTIAYNGKRYQIEDDKR